MAGNCWEFKKCGRQENGQKVAELGVCPAALDNGYNGKNRGWHGGRYCWKVAGTLCGGQVQGTFASKMMNCIRCDFFNLVKNEEGEKFQP